MVKNKVLLSELNEGALQERFDFELEQVTKNILDPNTDPIRSERSQLILLFYLMNIVKIWCLIVKLNPNLRHERMYLQECLLGKMQKVKL